MKYHTLILGRGRYESSFLPELIFRFNDGVDTPEELLTSFVLALQALAKVELTSDEEVQATINCPACNTKFAEKARYCHRCGLRKCEAEPLSEEDIRGFAAAKFQGWFEQELHEFSDYEGLIDLGWELGPLGNGGFVRSDGFDLCLFEGDMKTLIGEATVGVITGISDER